METFDVVIVGAGLSGIGAAWHLQNRTRNTTYAILEARDAIGGTWDLFRYPGIRSDSDMYTLGYRFKPWTEAKAIADGPSILRYVTETAQENGIDDHIRFRHKVVAAHWSSFDAAWTIEAEFDGQPRRFRCNYLSVCAGYYAYDAGYRPHWPGEERFAGQWVHPQHWPETLDYAGKRVVVIGSGATAMTIVPEMAKSAALVTMLQRSPTYVVSQPAEDALARRMQAMLPSRLSYALTRWRKVLLQQFFYRMTRTRPARVKAKLLDMARAAIGDKYVAEHFTPAYNPWDQRLCLIPDNDLFDAITSGKASVVTDTIAHFERDGIRLASGELLEADIVVTATGLRLNAMGDIALSVDGAPVDLGKALIYKGMMLGDVPNIAFTFGYTNASWTLKADLVSEYTCRVINHMRAQNTPIATPITSEDIEPEPFLDFSSGYVQRALDILPKQGREAPWKLHQNYTRDLLTLRFGKVDDGTMVFSRPTTEAPIAA
ncbi:MAG: flavin-containing monooxygenase [Sphingomonadaceae bacterium]